MSLSHSLNSAFSGLTASAKAASVVAENMANLRTPGFGRREVLLGSGSIGGGVMVNGVLRHSDPVLLGERRNAQALSAGAQRRMDFHRSVEDWLGLPGAAGSLDGAISRFDSALITAAGAPGSEAALVGVLDSAQTLAAKLRDVSRQVQQARSQADQSIARDVDVLNTNLSRIEALNRDIQRMTTLRQDASALVDQRQVLIDAVAEAIPLREVARENGRYRRKLVTPDQAAF